MRGGGMDRDRGRREEEEEKQGKCEEENTSCGRNIRANGRE